MLVVSLLQSLALSSLILAPILTVKSPFGYSSYPSLYSFRLFFKLFYQLHYMLH